ncbi:hypothetical protein ACTUSX_11470 [Pantoea ananatis]|uniref:hypothetical protein n=1 Tax=Pantoea ananas TaxID=553 RepID=UPI003FA43ED7
MEWIKYSERKPDAAGVYLWRMSSRKVDGLTVIARAKMRLRSAGYENVLSPEFDYWNGYSLVLPGELEWSENEESVSDISFENLAAPSACPFCKNVPSIKAFEWDGGCRIRPEPYILNQFQLKCCGWIAPVTFKSPIIAIEEWNKKLAE